MEQRSLSQNINATPDKGALKLTVVLLLFALAIFFWGIKNVDIQQKRKALELFTQGLVDTIKFASSLGLPKVKVGFDVGKNKDTLTVDLINKKVTSERNFIYHYNGYTIKCSVSVEGNVYRVECEAE